MRKELQERDVNKVATIGCITILASIATPLWAAEKTNIFLNTNIGYAAEGGRYNYAQSQYPCGIDKELVKQIEKKAPKKGIKIVKISKESEFDLAENILAIDFNDLPDGRKDFVGSKSVAPKLGLEVAFFDKNKKELGVRREKWHCSGSLSQGGSSTMNVRAGGGAASSTVNFCKEMRRCSRILSKRVLKWVSKEIVR